MPLMLSLGVLISLKQCPYLIFTIRNFHYSKILNGSNRIPRSIGIILQPNARPLHQWAAENAIAQAEWAFSHRRGRWFWIQRINHSGLARWWVEAWSKYSSSFHSLRACDPYQPHRYIPLMFSRPNFSHRQFSVWCRFVSLMVLLDFEIFVGSEIRKKKHWACWLSCSRYLWMLFFSECRIVYSLEGFARLFVALASLFKIEIVTYLQWQCQNRQDGPGVIEDGEIKKASASGWWMRWNSCLWVDCPAVKKNLIRWESAFPPMLAAQLGLTCMGSDGLRGFSNRHLSLR